MVNIPPIPIYMYPNRFIIYKLVPCEIWLMIRREIEHEQVFFKYNVKTYISNNDEIHLNSFSSQ